MKKPVIFLGSLLVLTLVVIFGRDYVKGKVNPSVQSTRVARAESKTEIPQHVVYHALFRHVVWLQNKAAELERDGKDGAAFKNRYQRFASLTNQEDIILNQTATDTVNRVKELDKQIEALVKADRESRSNELKGKPLPSSPPPLNPDVTRLDKERQNTILAGHSRLREGFESDRFANFEKFVKDQVMTQIKPMSSSMTNLQRIPTDVPRTGLSKGGN
jgi:hypothetical protein